MVVNASKVLLIFFVVVSIFFLGVFRENHRVYRAYVSCWNETADKPYKNQEGIPEYIDHELRWRNCFYEKAFLIDPRTRN